MIFNSSFIIRLSLSSLVINSLLRPNSPNHFSKSIFFQNFNLNKSSLHKPAISSSTSHKNHLEQLLQKPISVQQTECSYTNGQTFTDRNTYNGPCIIVTYCTFRSIVSNSEGGAFSISNDGDITTNFYQCLFDSCVSKSHGGAISFVARLNNDLLGELIVTSTIFNYCYCDNEFNNSETCGGGLYCLSNSLQIANSTFNNNGIRSQSGACCGGAVYARVSNTENIFSYDTFEYCYIQIQQNSAETNLNSFGGAIFIVTQSEKSEKVELFACKFVDCSAVNGSSLYSQEGIDLIINSASFSNGNVNSVIYLGKDHFKNRIYIKALGISHVNYNYFIYAQDGQLDMINDKVDSGMLYLENDEKFNVATFSNTNFELSFVNYGSFQNMPTYTYVDQPLFITSSEITQVSSEPEIETQTQTQSENDQLTSSDAESSSIDEVTSSLIISETNESDNSGAATNRGRNGLSTVAIVFIVIACIIFVIGLIIASILLLRSRDGCYRNRCTGSDSYFGKRVDYF